MTCFWTRFIQSFDPDCAPGTTIYARPLRARHSYDVDPDPGPFNVYSDALLTVPLAPTVATITHVIAWDNTLDGGGCAYDAWQQGSAPYVSPPISPGTKIDEFDQLITFDPTVAVPPLGSITGVTDPGGTFKFEGNDQFVMVVTIVMDVGVCYLTVGADYCY